MMWQILALGSIIVMICCIIARPLVYTMYFISLGAIGFLWYLLVIGANICDPSWGTYIVIVVVTLLFDAVKTLFGENSLLETVDEAVAEW